MKLTQWVSVELGLNWLCQITQITSGFRAKSFLGHVHVVLLAMTIFGLSSSSLHKPRTECWNITSAQTFEQQCLDDAGNAAFWRFATSPESATPGTVAFTPTTTCFLNHRDSRDWLCIFRDFATGRTSVDDMSRSTLRQNLEVLFTEGWQLRGPQETANARNNAEHICFHKKGTGSVQWTHAHLFQELPPPDGMQLVGGRDTYCVSVGPLNAVAPPLAATLAAQEIARQATS
jgi:hypothetical protein